MYRRSTYAWITVLLWIIETWIALKVHDAWIRPYLGDVLVVILIYCFIKTLWPSLPWLRTLIGVLGFAYVVEWLQWLQWLHVLDYLGLSSYRWLRVILGSTFSWGDMACYTIGVGVVGSVEGWRQKRKETKGLCYANASCNHLLRS